MIYMLMFFHALITLAVMSLASAALAEASTLRRYVRNEIVKAHTEIARAHRLAKQAERCVHGHTHNLTDLLDGAVQDIDNRRRQ